MGSFALIFGYGGRAVYVYSIRQASHIQDSLDADGSSFEIGVHAWWVHAGKVRSYPNMKWPHVIGICQP